MVKPRVIETEEGIQGEFDVKIYDSMQRRFRDKGWIETPRIIKSGITQGRVLEIGSGPGYLGLEWLKNTKETLLQGVDISSEMIHLAEQNAREYGFEQRTRYVQSDAQRIPFDDNSFDAVFSNGSLHEWAEPKNVLNEIHRVLKPNGRYFISDLRRDINLLMKWSMYLITKPKEIRPGLRTSLNAAYTVDEIHAILNETLLKDAHITKNIIGLEITGVKA
jgi:ubiquinone/menaquinone biosynthesis C-methylase UbiE